MTSPTLNHVVFIDIDHSAPDNAADQIVAGLRALPAQIHEIGSYLVGKDLGISDNSSDIAIVATFANSDDLNTYRTHPAHVKVVEELINKWASNRHSVQFHSG